MYLGYEYSWYLHGPHCAKLATVGHAPGSICDMAPYDKDMVFVNPAVQERLEEFKRFIRGLESDGGFLEIAAPLRVLHRTSGMGRDAIIKRVEAEGERLRGRCGRVWEEMERWKLMG